MGRVPCQGTSPRDTTAGLLKKEARIEGGPWVRYAASVMDSNLLDSSK